MRGLLQDKSYHSHRGIPRHSLIIHWHIDVTTTLIFGFMTSSVRKYLVRTYVIIWTVSVVEQRHELGPICYIRIISPDLSTMWTSQTWSQYFYRDRTNDGGLSSSHGHHTPNP